MEEKWASISITAIEEKGYFAAALSGGRTPLEFYRRLSAVEGLPWDKTHIFLVDERFVPPESEDSNYRMLLQTLLSRISILPENIHPISTAENSPELSAEKYEEELRRFFGLSEHGVPEFDLILLGIGEEGHTASLFPATEALNERERLAVAVRLGEPLHDRITLTFPVINNAGNIFFLVTGKEKREILERLRQGNDPALPASMVNPERGKLIFLTDMGAGGG